MSCSGFLAYLTAVDPTVWPSDEGSKTGSKLASHEDISWYLSESESESVLCGQINSSQMVFGDKSFTNDGAEEKRQSQNKSCQVNSKNKCQTRRY